jgi:hypothetical protein
VRDALLALNDATLLFCVSMYLGTGWSLVLFSFPSRPSLTVSNYYDQFVPQVTRATRFFTVMTMVMIATAVVMLISEIRTAYVIAPIVVLAGVLVATGLTVKFILPLNRRMAAHLTDPDELGSVLDRWMRLNWVRVLLWTVQWSAMAAYFAVKSR